MIRLETDDWLLGQAGLGSSGLASTRQHRSRERRLRYHRSTDMGYQK